MPAPIAVLEGLEPLRARCVPEPNTGCWLWLEEREEPELSERAWVQLNGALPSGTRLRAACGTNECVNPAHLIAEGAAAR